MIVVIFLLINSLYAYHISLVTEHGGGLSFFYQLPKLFILYVELTAKSISDNISVKSLNSVPLTETVYSPVSLS